MQRLIFGYDLAYQMAYGAISAMAVLISATFFWLWWQRATPLALGMGFSWAGAGMVMGYWWVHNLLDRPDWMDENPEADKEDYDEKMKEVEQVANPIMRNVYAGGAGGGADEDMGDFDDGEL